MRMCERSTQPESKCIRRCLPRAATDSIVAPVGSMPRAPLRWVVRPSKRCTRSPASARCSTRAARRIESPSGMEARGAVR
jgi:hypothetical protein